MAREKLERASAELAASSDERLIYAALELRMAIEAVTYDRAQAFKAEIPPSEYEVWQPKKLMQLLLDIDPSVDKEVTISVGLEPSPGAAPTTIHTIGTDTPFSFRSIKAHYDALGSYLHLPTLRQFESGTAPDMKRLRSRCDEIVKELQVVLSSGIFNSTIGHFATLNCVRCNKPIHKRISPSKQKIEARCVECGAPYLISRVSEGRSEWQPQQTELECKQCNEAMVIWKDEIRAGQRLNCNGCSSEYSIELLAIRLGPTVEPSPGGGG